MDSRPVAPKQANDQRLPIKSARSWRPNKMPDWLPIKVPKSREASGTISTSLAG